MSTRTDKNYQDSPAPTRRAVPTSWTIGPLHAPIPVPALWHVSRFPFWYFIQFQLATHRWSSASRFDRYVILASGHRFSNGLEQLSQCLLWLCGRPMCPSILIWCNYHEYDRRILREEREGSHSDLMANMLGHCIGRPRNRNRHWINKNRSKPYEKRSPDAILSNDVPIENVKRLTTDELRAEIERRTKRETLKRVKTLELELEHAKAQLSSCSDWHCSASRSRGILVIFTGTCGHNSCVRGCWCE